MKTLGTLTLLALVAEAVRYVFFGRLGIQPDFLVGIVVLASLRLPPPRGAWAGLVLGLLRDLAVGTPAGTEALPMTLVGWAVGTLGRSVYREAFVTHVLMTVGACLAKSIMTYMLLRNWDPAGLPLYFFRIAVPGAVFTAILVPFVDRNLLRPRSRRFVWSRTTLRRLREHEGKTLIKR